VYTQQRFSRYVPFGYFTSTSCAVVANARTPASVKSANHKIDVARMTFDINEFFSVRNAIALIPMFVSINIFTFAL
jgi:hypothetical protein